MPDSPGSNVPIRLGDLKDVERGAPEIGDALVWDGTTWAPGEQTGASADLSAYEGESISLAAETIASMTAGVGMERAEIKVESGEVSILATSEGGDVSIIAADSILVAAVEVAIGAPGTETITLGATEIGFFGAPAAAQPTGVTVDAAGIHAALVALGLIAGP